MDTDNLKQLITNMLRVQLVKE